jgi:hypothetical protein
MRKMRLRPHFLAGRVEGCSGRTRPEVARKVGLIAEWEGDTENVVGLA